MQEHSLFSRFRAVALPVALLLSLASCGGGGGGSSGGDTPAPPPVQAPVITDADAAKLLTQATFGPTDAEIDSVKALGYAGWVNG